MAQFTSTMYLSWNKPKQIIGLINFAFPPPPSMQLGKICVYFWLQRILVCCCVQTKHHSFKQTLIGFKTSQLQITGYVAGMF